MKNQNIKNSLWIHILIMSSLVLLTLSTNVYADCRLLGMIAKYDSYLCDDTAMVEDLLDELQSQGSSNPHGWGLLYYKFDADTVDTNNIWRDEDPAYNNAYYDTVQTYFVNPDSGAYLGMGHVRYATTGDTNIPDPHPFVWGYTPYKYCYTFAHNGTLSKSVLRNLIGDSWLADHPPQTYGHGPWDGEGWDFVVDSELYFFLIMKNIIENDGNVLIGIHEALVQISSLSGAKNFIFSDNTAIYAYKDGYPLKYFGAPQYNVFAVMSDPPNPETLWTDISDSTLVYLPRIGEPHVFPDFPDMDYDVKYLYAEGWNWVSFPVLPDPDGTNALEVLEPILDTLILDKVVFEGKDVIYYEAGGWVNDLTDSNFRSIEGYKIKMKRDAELVISGVREEPETPIPLYAGDRTPEWYPMDYENWIGYFLPYSQSPHDAFANVWDKLTFIKADNYTLIRKWNSDEWWGAVSGPVSVDYGKSYIVGVTEDCTLIWGSGEPTSPYERPKTLVFDYQEQADYMPVFVDSTKALAGIDEIGVFLEDECIGASVVDGYPLFIPAYIEDEDSTGGKDYGELTFQVATYGKGGKRSIQAFVYNPAQNAFVQAPVTLDRDSYAVVRLGTGEGAESPKEFALYQNHPNPVTTSTTISFIPSPGAESSEIKIYNIKGQLIRELEFSPPAGGSDSGFDEATWDGRDAHGRQVANGIYFYKVTSGDKTAVKKMLVLH